MFVEKLDIGAVNADSAIIKMVLFLEDDSLGIKQVNLCCKTAHGILETKDVIFHVLPDECLSEDFVLGRDILRDGRESL